MDARWIYSGVCQFAALTAVITGGITLWPAPPKLDLSVREQDGLLLIAWSRSAANRARLEIIDGGDHTAMFVHARLASVTYAAQSGDVEIRLAAVNDDSQSEMTRYVTNETVQIEELSRRIRRLESEIRALRAETRKRAQRVERMQGTADKMLRVANLPAPTARPVPTVRVWRER
jgi:hypothetical protein